MTASFERVNYAVRPGKSIERKMLCGAFFRLSEFASVESYRYVGFGSAYFSDFILVHRLLGITNMVSIERHEQNAKRVLFNRPFACIDVKFGESNDELPALDWGVRSIVWLDYDGTLDPSVLADVRFICMSLVPGSAFAVTVNAQPPAPAVAPNDALAQVTKRLGDKMPENISPADLSGWGTAGVYRRAIDNEIAEVLADRNAARPPQQKFIYKQLFNFNYRDGQRMLTVGGVIYESGQQGLFDKCSFFGPQGLLFVRGEADPYLIDVPMLTYRELRHQDAQLPCSDLDGIDRAGVPREDVERYSRHYRYFPMFVEAEL